MNDCDLSENAAGRLKEKVAMNENFCLEIWNCMFYKFIFSYKISTKVNNKISLCIEYYLATIYHKYLFLQYKITYSRESHMWMTNEIDCEVNRWITSRDRHCCQWEKNSIG